MKPLSFVLPFWKDTPVVISRHRPNVLAVYGCDIHHLRRDLFAELGETISEKVNVRAEDGVILITLPSGCENRVYETLNRYNVTGVRPYNQ